MRPPRDNRRIVGRLSDLAVGENWAKRAIA
jgi:hypothetical protein